MRFVHDVKYVQDAWMVVRNKPIDRAICAALVLVPAIINIVMLTMNGYFFIIPLVFVLLFIGVFINAEVQSRHAQKNTEIQRFLTKLRAWFQDSTGDVATDVVLRKLLNKTGEFTIGDYRFTRSLQPDLVVIFAEKILSDTMSASRLAQRRREELRQQFPDDRIFL